MVISYRQLRMAYVTFGTNSQMSSDIYVVSFGSFRVQTIVGSSSSMKNPVQLTRSAKWQARPFVQQI